MLRPATEALSQRCYELAILKKIATVCRKTTAMDPPLQNIELKTSMHFHLHLKYAFI